jgi:hypothetical protein
VTSKELAAVVRTCCFRSGKNDEIYTKAVTPIPNDDQPLQQHVAMNTETQKSSSGIRRSTAVENKAAVMFSSAVVVALHLQQANTRRGINSAVYMHHPLIFIPLVKKTSLNFNLECYGRLE